MKYRNLIIMDLMIVLIALGLITLLTTQYYAINALMKG